MSSLISCRLIDSQTLVVRPLESRYGSLAVGELRALGSELRSAARRFSAECVLVDLSEVCSIGAGFVGELIGLRRQLRSMGRDLAVRHDPEGILELLGLGDIVECCDGECLDDALCAGCA